MPRGHITLALVVTELVVVIPFSQLLERVESTPHSYSAFYPEVYGMCSNPLLAVGYDFSNTNTVES